MVQVDPAARTFAERARQEPVNARRRRDPNLRYYEENYRQWTLSETATSAAMTILKSYGTGQKARQAMEWLLHKHEEHEQIVRPPQPTTDD